MTRLLNFILFFAIFLTIYLGLHYFYYRTIVASFPLNHKAVVYIRWFFIVSMSSVIVGNIMARFLPIYFIREYGYFWLGIVSIAFAFIIMMALVNRFIPAHKFQFALFSIIMILFMTVVAIINNARFPAVKTYTIEVKGQKILAKDFSIVQISDLHLTNNTNPAWLEKIVTQIDRLNPDLIVITGDMIEENIKKPDIGKIFTKLKAPLGVLAVTGNHEYYVGIHYVVQFCQQSGIHLLRNESLTLANGVTVIGFDDSSFIRKEQYLDQLQHICRNIPNSQWVILLNHQPRYFSAAQSFGVDFQLSGHTHYGQIPPFNWIVKLIYKHPFGLFQEKGAYIYTTSGTGWWGPPMRIFSRSEIVLFNIKK